MQQLASLLLPLECPAEPKEIRRGLDHAMGDTWHGGWETYCIHTYFLNCSSRIIKIVTCFEVYSYKHSSVTVYMISFGDNIKNLCYKPFMNMSPRINGSADLDQKDPRTYVSTWHHSRYSVIIGWMTERR